MCATISTDIPSYEAIHGRMPIQYGKSDYYCSIVSQPWDFALLTISKRSNLDINDAAYLHIVHILQHPTSHLTTRSMQITMINDLKKNFSPLPACQYGNQKCSPLNNLIKPMEAIVAWKQTLSEPLGHCAACDRKCRLRQRNDQKRTS
jgi:hypothetical protein